MVRRRGLKTVIAGLVMCAAMPAWAQAVGGIRGLTYDASFNVPVGEVQVVIAETGRRVVSQAQGNFVFPEVEAGTYTLIFTKEGFSRQVKASVVVTAGRFTELDVRLAADFEVMDDVAVQDLATPPVIPIVVVPLPRESEASLINLRLESPAVIDAIGADLIKQAGASNAAAALNYVAGASVQDGKYAVIRGLPDRYVNSQMNGVRLPTADVDKRAVQLDQFPAAVIESIQVSKSFTPDQQGDASGGAVNVILKGVPNETFMQMSSQTGFNTQTQGRHDFLSYRGGGVSLLGFDDGRRGIPGNFLLPEGGSSPEAVGVSYKDSPLNSKWNFSAGIKQDLNDGYKIGGLMSISYERNNTSYRHGRDDNYVMDVSGHMVPQGFNPDTSTDQVLHLYDVSKSTQEVKWSTLATLGIESKEQSLSVVHLYTRAAEDSAVLTQDVRGKQYIFPGYNPNDIHSPGFDLPNVAPYTRGETLTYRERETQTLQFHGRHVIPTADFGIQDILVFTAPELDWTAALSSSGLNEPDKRVFGSLWTPRNEIDLGLGPDYPPVIVPARWVPFRAGNSNINLGTVQHIWKDIEEESTQYMVNLKLPFKQWTDSDGYLKVGIFNDDVKRQYHQQSFHNGGEIASGPSFEGEFNEFWSAAYPHENHLISAAFTDADYNGSQKISAFYAMMDLPLTPELNVIGGVRFESTDLTTTIINPEKFVYWVPPGANQLVVLHPGDADVAFQQRDVLPSIGLIYRPFKELTLRTSYTETTARQTFKELTPIQQSEYFGGPIFVGNPALQMSALQNFDLRADYVPYEGSLISISYFHKNVKNPIEYVQQDIGFTYTFPENYPSGKLDGIEMEIRQDLGQLFEGCEGLSIGGNATLIKSAVTLPEGEANQFTPALKTRDMTNTPAFLYNAYANYDIKPTDTHLSLFYTVRGDTLVAGAGGGGGGIVIPSIYETEYGTLNFGLTQKFGKYVNISFQAKNLTNSPVQSVYRSDHVKNDTLKTTRTNGVEFAFSVGVKFEF